MRHSGGICVETRAGSGYVLVNGLSLTLWDAGVLPEAFYSLSKNKRDLGKEDLVRGHAAGDCSANISKILFLETVRR
jgi:hypothetical protein